MVVNTAPALALTQNFVPKTQLPAALEFLEKQAQSVSGFNCDKVKDPSGLFVRKMSELYPDELRKAREVLEARRNKRSKWDQLVESGSGGGFSFGFGGDDSSDGE